MKALTMILLIMMVGLVALPAAADDYKITGFYRATITTPTNFEFPYNINFCQVNVTDGASLEFTLATADADSSAGALKYPDALSHTPVMEALLGIPFDNGKLGNVQWIRMFPVGGPVTVKIPYSKAD